MRRNSQTAAERLIDDLVTLDVLDTDTTDDAMGNDALEACAAIVFDFTHPASIRLMATRLLLTFIRPKPAGRSAVTLEGGMDFLRGLAAEAAKVRADADAFGNTTA